MSFKLLTQWFPLWALFFSVLAFYFPEPFAVLKPGIIPLLSVIMLAMGMTLKLDDFRRVLSRPKVIILGLLLQFLVMPLAAYLISLGLNLPIALLTGMLLVGVSSGGTASNVICYLARGDVALSISLTLCSTLLAVLAMPALTWLYLGERVPVPVLSMLLAVLKIVLLPVLGGVLLNHYWGQRLSRFMPVFPAISVLAIVLIIAIIVALNQQRIEQLSLLVMFAVILHNLTGLVAGFWGSRLMGYSTTICRTLAIEVGMQNSGLSVALAIKFFSPVAALPGAIFSIWHNLSGSLLASFWSKQDVESNN